MPVKLSQNSLNEAAGRLILVMFYAWMLWNSAVHFANERQFDFLVAAILQIMVIGFVLLRKTYIRLSSSLIDWLVALLPTLMPFFLNSAYRPSVLGEILQYGGFLLLIISVASLNSSLGIIAADRGIKTGGAYRIIRHPCFLGYIMANIGVLLTNPTNSNFLYVSGGVILQIIRLQREETFLAQNMDYREYMLKTRWRLLPGIW